MMRPLACLAAFLVMLATSTASLKVFSRDVDHRNTPTSGSQNDRDFWKSALDNMKVMVDHAGKQQINSMNIAYWEVDMKSDSPDHADPGTHESGTVSKGTLPGETVVSLRSFTNSVSMRGKAAEATASQKDKSPHDGETATQSQVNEVDDLLSPYRHTFPQHRLFLYTDSQENREGNILGQRFPTTSELPEGEEPARLVVEPEPHISFLRASPMWAEDEPTSEYVNCGEAGFIKLFAESLSGWSAKERCEQDGAHLATVDSDAKVAALLDFYDKYPSVPKEATLNNQVYVGMNDRDEEGVFRTATGELYKPWNASIWLEGEPNDGDGREDCVTFRMDGRIRDVPCTFDLPFFCEKDKM